MKEKVFLVFNTAAFGDVLLCNSLCQNIRKNFPNAKIVFVADKPFYDVAKYQQDVDEVIVFDKKGIHKGLSGLLRFIKSFPYKRAYCSLLTYKNERNFLISLLTGAQKIIRPKRLYDGNVQLAHTMLLSKLDGVKVENLPIRYNVPNDAINNAKELVGNTENYVTLCCLSKNPKKDMPIDVAIEIMHQLNAKNCKPVFVGARQKAQEYAKSLENANCEFINLVDKTSIIELSGVLKNSKCLISIDTGTMHLGYAVGCPTVAIFYRKNTAPIWAPNPALYNVKVIEDDFSAENILKSVETLMGGN